MKAVKSFASQFEAKVEFNPDFIVELNQRIYLLNPALRKVAKKDFYYAGLYLGKTKNGVFFPSFNLLNNLAGMAVDKVVLNRKAAWLFICGRDVFQSGILKIMGTKHKGNLTLVLNEFGECLGFGKITSNLERVDVSSEGKIAVKNILDIGDFLRREKNTK